MQTKKTYTPPKLARLGTVSQLTLANAFDGSADGGAGLAMAMAMAS